MIRKRTNLALVFKIFGMPSVNGYDGAVWYHDRHRAYVRSLEEH